LQPLCNRFASAIALQSLCNRLTIDSQVPCNRFAITLHLLYNSFADSLQLPLNPLAVALQSPHNRLTTALQSLCIAPIALRHLYYRFAIASLSLRIYFAIAAQLLYNRLAFALK
jgi:hypothetical protein